LANIRVTAAEIDREMQQLVRSTPCPKCCAAVGAECKTANGFWPFPEHAGRRAAHPALRTHEAVRYLVSQREKQDPMTLRRHMAP
jgi:hypothetical protein